MNAAQNPLNACPYWVGDILVTMSEIQPAQRWPGTSWEQITDCMLRAADDTHPAASPAAVANAVPEMEYGCFVSPTTISENKIYQYTVNFSNSHGDVPKTVLLSYRTYNYFNGYVHIDTDVKNAGVDRLGFTFVYIPTDIGNGLANLYVDWLAIW